MSKRGDEGSGCLAQPRYRDGLVVEFERAWSGEVFSEQRCEEREGRALLENGGRRAGEMKICQMPNFRPEARKEGNSCP